MIPVTSEDYEVNVPGDPENAVERGEYWSPARMRDVELRVRLARRYGVRPQLVRVSFRVLGGAAFKTVYVQRGALGEVVGDHTVSVGSSLLVACVVDTCVCVCVCVRVRVRSICVCAHTCVCIQYNTIQLYCLYVEKFAFWLVIYIKTFNTVNNKHQQLNKTWS